MKKIITDSYKKFDLLQYKDNPRQVFQIRAAHKDGTYTIETYFTNKYIGRLFESELDAIYCKILRDERAEQNIQIHELKLELEFCDEVESGRKPFEIRFNDRNYKKGDLIRYIPVLNGNPTKHTISNNTYEITYVLSGYGLMEGYVAFGQKEITTEIAEVE